MSEQYFWSCLCRKIVPQQSTCVLLLVFLLCSHIWNKLPESVPPQFVHHSFFSKPITSSPRSQSAVRYNYTDGCENNRMATVRISFKLYRNSSAILPTNSAHHVAFVLPESQLDCFALHHGIVHKTTIGSSFSYLGQPFLRGAFGGWREMENPFNMENFEISTTRSTLKLVWKHDCRCKAFLLKQNICVFVVT